MHSPIPLHLEGEDKVGTLTIGQEALESFLYMGALKQGAQNKEVPGNLFLLVPFLRDSQNIRGGNAVRLRVVCYLGFPSSEALN